MAHLQKRSGHLYKHNGHLAKECCCVGECGCEYELPESVTFMPDGIELPEECFTEGDLSIKHKDGSFDASYTTSEPSPPCGWDTGFNGYVAPTHGPRIAEYQDADEFTGCDDLHTATEISNRIGISLLIDVATNTVTLVIEFGFEGSGGGFTIGYLFHGTMPLDEFCAGRGGTFTNDYTSFAIAPTIIAGKNGTVTVSI